MRPIKFRAWDGKRMINVCTLEMMKGTNGVYIGASEGYWGDNHRREFSLSDVQLMQYTGLKDKNGNDCYEGDIVKHPAFGNQKVVWNYGGFGIDVRGVGGFTDGFHSFSTVSANYQECEIIGNIYENLDLLAS